MKRIYLFVIALMLTFSATQSYAQSTDMQLITYGWKNGDTVKWNTSGSIGMIIQWGFKNIGPTALVQATDTLLMKRAYTVGGNNTVKLTLPTAGVPVGDTVYFRDTVFFTSGPTTNPYNWCDSIWVKRGANVMSDPSIANNRNCFSLHFKQMSVGVANVATAENALVVYPNPAANTVSVKYNFVQAANANVVVKDMTGKTVLSNSLGKGLVGSQEFKLDVSSLASGLYVMELYANDEKHVTKFSVQK